MSMVIGKEAREALQELGKEGMLVHRDNIQAILDRCTDAPEVGGSEPVAAIVEHDGTGYGKRRSVHLLSRGDPRNPEYWINGEMPSGHSFTLLYAHPPEFGLPEGWVAVPVEPTEFMIDAYTDAPIPAVLLDSRRATQKMEFVARLRAAFSAAPPCPGVVSLPDGFPWDDDTREYLRFLLLHARDRALNVHTETANAAFELARWLESAGQKESGE